jgi:hypothetical protein
LSAGTFPIMAVMRLAVFGIAISFQRSAFRRNQLSFDGRRPGGR